MSEIVLSDIKGSTGSLDPRSKILTTLIYITGIAISLDFFQIFLYLLLYIPIIILFKPRLVFLKRVLFPLFVMVFLAIFLYLGIQTERVTLKVLTYSRTYSKLEFIGLIIYRYFIIILFNYMLLHSEQSHTDIIEALASFKLGTTLITILLLIKRISTKVSMDYQKMLLAAESKGAFNKNLINLRGLLKNFYIRLMIIGRTIGRTAAHSDVISRTLTARGFHNYFQPTIRPWSSEGITVTLLSFVFFVSISIIPWMR